MIQKLVRTFKNYYHLGQAVIACLVYRFPAYRLTVIGVTGTDGKTTTATLIYQMLKMAKYRVALVNTVGAYIGDTEMDTGFHVTTPNSWQLQKLLNMIRALGYTHVVLEATSHGLDQNRLWGTNIKIAVVTNISHEHMDYHHTFENYIKTKGKIFKVCDTAIVNKNTKYLNLLVGWIPKKSRLITYDLKSIDADNNGVMKVIKTKFNEKYNLENALAAVEASRQVGITDELLISALNNFIPVRGRLEKVVNNLGIDVWVDFAHTPNALSSVLSTLKNRIKGKLIVVFGSAGKRDVTKRPLMGKVAIEIADEAVITSEDPRGEDPRLIIDQIKSGMLINRGHAHGIVDRKEAIRFAVKLAKKGDTVVICGKGHEKSMNFDGKHEVAWSDIEITKEIVLSLQ